MAKIGQMLLESIEFGAFNMFSMESKNTVLQKENETLQHKIHCLKQKIKVCFIHNTKFITQQFV